MKIFEKPKFQLGELKLNYEDIKNNYNNKIRYTATNCIRGTLNIYLSFNKSTEM